MPFETETPSYQELRAYLREKLKGSGIAMIADYPANQARYHPEVAESVEFLASSPTCGRFLTSVSDTLLASLQKLNQLSRDDSFWSNTNRRPTIFKLTEFGELVLHRNPDDELALMTRATLDVVFVREFEPAAWSRLYELRAVDFEYVLFAALVLEVAGAPSAAAFGEWLNLIGRNRETEVLISRVRMRRGALFARWSAAVMDSLNGS